MDLLQSFPFYIGLAVTFFYAWGRFDEPSFTKDEALPSAVVPLRYLFFRPAYARARLAYVVCSSTLYVVITAAGKPIGEQLLGIKAENFPADAWPLSVALVMVGVLPNANMKLVNQVEERLRRAVHAWFLVPDGVKETIAVMVDSAYKPPPGQLEAVDEPLQSRIRQGLAEQRGSLNYRWARAAMLMESINQMENDAQHPLVRKHFVAFEDDLEAIRQIYKVLRTEMETTDIGTLGDDAQAALRERVNRLLRRIYAFISWGVRHYARSDRAVVDTLGQCGFVVPVVEHGRQLFDIVFPAFLAVVTLVFLYTWAWPSPGNTFPVQEALTSAFASGLMYGISAWIALRKRGQMIEDGSWQPGSPRCLASIAVRTGLVTWAAIVLATVAFGFDDAVKSVRGLSIGAMEMTSPTAEALWLPDRIGTAAPWFLAGATFSVLLTKRFDGDLQRLGWRHRAADALMIGGGLAVAAVLALVIQQGLEGGQASLDSLGLLFVVAFLIGGTMGFTVPAAFRRDIIRPVGARAQIALRDLLNMAGRKLGGAAEARRWAFTPPEDDTAIPITPAEALRYQNYATSVRALLDEEPVAAPPVMSVVEGGRLAG